MTTLGKLVCGVSNHSGDAKDVLDQLSTSIDRFAVKATNFLHDDFSEDAQSFGAFCARVVLENSCAGLVGRLDPFRLLYLRAFQAQATYEYGKPAKSAFRWSGDVFTSDKPNTDMWSCDHDTSKISRALFSQYSAELHWGPAFTLALDAITASDTPSDIFETLTNVEANEFVGKIKGQCATTYSTLSKGVHWEFFVSSVMMDEDTLKDTIRNTLVVMSDLAFVSHFIPAAYHSLPPAEAIDTYISFRRTLQ
ncbi:hypothetical protein G6M85_11285 [Agrobacterium tumefaciens]|uniref:hypothetical protein n=1 Tax=Agrobacterium tumefaciens TaxID=358 RepID=UPI0015744F87|nr:hypothetical protein [Agrobacterium tumefaciens]NTE66192.1 hypothetical protein [Agrobacterium tumefaciens]